MGERKSVILLSGGLDSAANLAFCKDRDIPILALTATYGQKAEKREIEAAQALCRYYNVPHEIIDVSWLGRLGGSALTSRDSQIPTLEEKHLNDLNVTQDLAQKVWVPNRNGIFIHYAAAFAERMNAVQVVVGFNLEEAVTFPDNSEEYLNRVSAALELSTANHVKVFCYTLRWNKVRIVQELQNLPIAFPFNLIWSCYEGGDRPCQKCESCKRLARALKAK